MLAPAQLGRIHGARLRGTRYIIGTPLTEPVGRSLFLYGTYEPLATEVFAALLGEDDIAVDVGAHYGDFTLVGSFMVGQRGRVLTFEPQPEMKTVLERNLTRNAIANVDVFALALSDFRGSAPLFCSRDQRHTASASLSADHAGQAFDFLVTPVERLDDLIPHEDMKRVAAMKIDVEGEEGRVLLGALATLARSGAALILEVNDLREGPHGVSCPAFDVLRELHYTVFGMVAKPHGFVLEKIPFGSDPQPYCEPWLALNVVAIKAGSIAEDRLQSAGRFA